eukprot:scaffold42709_cov73-Phaeocystis_antarctica.AAC.1
MLGQARVDDIDDVVDGDRRLGDVARRQDLARARRRRLEDLGLSGHVARQVGVDGDLGAEAARAVQQRLRADSISSCPVKKLSTLPGSGCVMWICSVVTTAAST